MMKDNAPDFMIFLFFLSVCFILYFNALGNGFILDDNFLIVENQFVKDFSVQKIFSTDVFYFHPDAAGDSSKYYRPLQLLSYSFEYLIWRLNPLGYRLDNIILQSLNGFLLFLLVLSIFKNRVLAFFSGLFFCIHPAQVCLVTFVAGRSNLLEMFFILLSMTAFTYFVLMRKRAYYAASLLFYVAALFTREGALLLPLYILLCAAAVKISRERIALLLTPYIVIAAVYVSMRTLFMPCDKFAVAGSVSLNTAGNFFVYVQNYFWQLILPLNVKIALLDGNSMLKTIFYVCSCLFFMYLLTRALMVKNKALIFGLCMYFIGLLPVMKLDEIMKYFGPVLTEHYVYNASIGFCIILSYALLVLFERRPAVYKILCISFIVYFSLLTVMSNYHYRDEKTFYTYVLSVDRRNVIARLNLGNAYYDRQEYDRAIAEAEQVLHQEPDAWDGYLLLGNALSGKHERAKAANAYRAALTLNPRSERIWNNLGLAYEESGELDKAGGAFEKALALAPESPVVLANMAGYLIRKGEYDKALEICQKFLVANRNDADRIIAVGISFAKAGYVKPAEIFFKEALRIAPLSFDAMKNLGALYGNTGDIDSAIRLFKQARKVRPDNAEIKALIDQALLRK
jgi:protein O-mannosyl-transferase